LHEGVLGEERYCGLLRVTPLPGDIFEEALRTLPFFSDDVFEEALRALSVEPGFQFIQFLQRNIHERLQRGDFPAESGHPPFKG
jgi:hypothetical protein